MPIADLAKLTTVAQGMTPPSDIDSTGLAVEQARKIRKQAMAFREIHRCTVEDWHRARQDFHRRFEEVRASLDAWNRRPRLP